jgi:general secretion pathway protein D
MSLASADRDLAGQTPPQPNAAREVETEPMTPVQTSTDRTASHEALAAASGPSKPQPPAALPPVRMPALTDPGMADEPVSVNFEKVDIRTVLQTIGQITGINFIPHESVTGNVTVMSPTPIRLGDMYAFLQTILDVYGYAAIESDNAVKIVSKTEATKHSTQVRIGADPAYIPRNDALVTQIMPLRYATVTEIGEIIKPTLSTAAQMAVYPRTNSIMITDTSANIFRAAQVIQQLDVEGSRERVLTIPLRFASAQVLSEQIVRILEKADMATGQIARARTTPSYNQAVRVLPDERTNSVIAVANEQDMETIRQLVAQLDIARPTGTDTVQVAYLKNADANEVAAALERAVASMRISGTVDATQPIQVTAHASTNSLIIVASAQDYEVLSKIIDKLDIVREQVLVEARIVEVTEEALKQIGVDWATLDDVVSSSVRGFGITNLGPRVDFLSGDLEGLAVGAWKGTDSNVKIGAILHALEKQSGVNILSMPQIMTTNHRKAKIIVGENRPFVTDSRITETTDPATPTVIRSFEYKDVGITLEVTPHVSQGGMVRLDVNSEFTKLIEDVAATSLDTPVTAKRSAQTVVSMNSGNTVIIGGLMRDDTTRVTQQVPVVGSLPLVGPLFRSQRDRLQKTNLLIFITPIVMASQEQLLEATNRMQQQMHEVQEKGK